MNKMNQKGYAILFTVVLVSIVSLITIGLSNTIFKQLLISSGAKDSQLAYFQSDMAIECALYADINNFGIILEKQSNFYCGVDKYGSPINLKKVKNNNNYIITKNNNNNNNTDSADTDPCFEIEIKKENNNNTKKEDTTIKASGYNICNKTGIRAVERTIVVKY